MVIAPLAEDRPMSKGGMGNRSKSQPGMVQNRPGSRGNAQTPPAPGNRGPGSKGQILPPITGAGKRPISRGAAGASPLGEDISPTLSLHMRRSKTADSVSPSDDRGLVGLFLLEALLL